MADGLRDAAAAERVYCSRRSGWHWGMRNYGHEHRKTCQRMRKGGYWGDSEGSQNRAWQRRSFGAGGRPVEN